MCRIWLTMTHNHTLHIWWHKQYVKCDDAISLRAWNHSWNDGIVGVRRRKIMKGGFLACTAERGREQVPTCLQKKHLEEIVKWLKERPTAIHTHSVGGNLWFLYVRVRLCMCSGCVRASECVKYVFMRMPPESRFTMSAQCNQNWQCWFLCSVNELQSCSLPSRSGGWDLLLCKILNSWHTLRNFLACRQMSTNSEWQACKVKQYWTNHQRQKLWNLQIPSNVWAFQTFVLKTRLLYMIKKMSASSPIIVFYSLLTCVRGHSTPSMIQPCWTGC